jgi:hypothetical protein
VDLNQIKWASVKKAAGKQQPIRMTLALIDAKGKPVMESVRQDAAKWEPPWLGGASRQRLSDLIVVL